MDKSNLQPPYSLKALLGRDKATLSTFVDVHSPHVYRLALRILQNEQDAEDIMQETFIKAIRALPNFEGRSSIDTWLYRITTNEALMLLRKKKNVSHPDKSIDDDSWGERPELLIDWCCLPEKEFNTTETLAVLEQAAGRLPETLRVVFILRDIEGWNTKETAEILNLTEVAVKTRLSRARHKLREELSEYFQEKVERTETMRENE